MTGKDRIIPANRTLKGNSLYTTQGRGEGACIFNQLTGPTMSDT